MPAKVARLRILLRATRLDLADPRLPTNHRRSLWIRLAELERRLAQAL